jgi:16S rRNA (cytidine1402-2'-O)-methyltransferase
MLYIIATPLGNLGDITDRAKELLGSCDLVIAENPLHSKRLFDHFDLPKKRFLQFADFNEERALDQVLTEIKKIEVAGGNSALISDAGMPGISDPGFRVVRAAVAEGIVVSPIPGASAAVSALAASGLPTDKFVFFGFPPKTEPKLLRLMEEAKSIDATAVLYESPQRIVKTLSYIAGAYPEAQVCVARELTKIHEEFVRGSVQTVHELLAARPSIKGEITLVLSFK